MTRKPKVHTHGGRSVDLPSLDNCASVLPQSLFDLLTGFPYVLRMIAAIPSTPGTGYAVEDVFC